MNHGNDAENAMAKAALAIGAIVVGGIVALGFFAHWLVHLVFAR